MGPPEGRRLLSVLADLDSTHGQAPGNSALVADAAGNLYGTTLYGGANHRGSVFKLAAGSHAFSVVAALDVAVGRAAWGGATDDGTLYEIAAGTRRTATTPPAGSTSTWGWRRRRRRSETF